MRDEKVAELDLDVEASAVRSCRRAAGADPRLWRGRQSGRFLGRLRLAAGAGRLEIRGPRLLVQLQQGLRHGARRDGGDVGPGRPGAALSSL